MTNPLNHGVLTGRISQDIKPFANNDGSKTLLMTIAVDDNFVSGPDRKAKTQFIPVRAYIPASVSGHGSWDRVHKGDLVTVMHRLAASPYEKNGETVYPDVAVETDGFPQFLETKAVTDAREARKAVAAPAVAATPVNETPEQHIARLQAELAATKAPQDNYDNTSPFPG